MKYSTNEQVKLLDNIEMEQGGALYSAVVVFIEAKGEATEEFEWLLDEKPDWAKNTIAIKWNNYETIKHLFFVSKEAEDGSDGSVLFTDVTENDEIRFISRNS